MANETSHNARATRWQGFALNVLLFALLVAGIRIWQHRDMADGSAPALQARTLAGPGYTLPAHPGRPVLVHFWATWCPVCRAEQDSIAAIARDHPEVITVAMQSGAPDAVARHMREQKIDFPVVNDQDGAIARAWGVHAVPASFIITPDGQLRFIEVGYTTSVGLRLRLWLAGF